MLRHQYAEQAPIAEVDTGVVHTAVVDTSGIHDGGRPPVGRSLSPWRVALRKWVTVVLERTLGECWAPNPRTGLLVLLAIAVLLTTIAVTLSVGNALLVLVVGVVMRVSCDRRSLFRRT
jgi:hypothetical protein